MVTPAAIMRRNFWLRILVAANICILLYLGFHHFGRSKLPSPLQSSSANSDDPDRNLYRQIFNVARPPQEKPQAEVNLGGGQPVEAAQIPDSPTPDAPVVVPDVVDDYVDKESLSDQEKDLISDPILESEKQIPNSGSSTPKPTPKSSTITKPLSSPEKSPDTSVTISCLDKDTGARVAQRSGDYWVYYNYVRAEKKFMCNETITYTTHGEYTFMHNLEPLLKRWQGPLSLAVFTPGDDYMTALKAVWYYRECLNTSLVKDFVTFHFYFPFQHMPNASVLTQAELANFKADCNVRPSVIEEKVNTYRNASGIDYPVNVGRNIARETANSHFIFPSDIELYPNPGLIQDFLSMIRRNEKHLTRKNPRVFVSSIFEIEKNATMPNTKKELIPLLKNGTVVPFHHKVCAQCHTIPKAKEWSKAEISDKLNVFHVAKRTPPYSHWEPIYIGTHDDPYYDERLTWEGRSDKMTQGYQLCVLNYDFMILDNAFLIHRPGIKTKSENLNQTQKDKVAAQNKLISKTIMPELKKLFGVRKGCEK